MRGFVANANANELDDLSQTKCLDCITEDARVAAYNKRKALATTIAAQTVKVSESPPMDDFSHRILTAMTI